jgi:hypothetical protein
MDILDKLSIHTSDYVAAVDVHPDMLSHLVACSEGVAYSGNQKSMICRSVSKVSKLEDSAFDKVVAPYDPHLVDDLIRIADHMSMVLILDVPNTEDSLLPYLTNNGIYEQWCFDSGSKDSVDLLFKVRKY